MYWLRLLTVTVLCILTALAFSKHYRKVGQSFCGLARSFELDDRPGLFVALLCASLPVFSWIVP